MKQLHSNSTKRKIISDDANSNDEYSFLSTEVLNKKLKTNSGKSSAPVSSTGSSSSTNPACVRTAEEILRAQQNINQDTNIDCDGFREIFVSDLQTQLQEAIYSEQCIVLREAAGSKGYNANSKELFTFENVIARHADMEIECRIQNPTIYDYNVDSQKNQQHIYRTTIGEYGEYARLLSEQKYDEIKKKEYYRNYFAKLSSGVMFAVNIDMDDYAWRSENNRLRATLPHFMLNKGKHDMLSYHRQNVMGCTQPQMYLKVPGVWTGGHQENISVRAININHGDGESDWYCVAYPQVEKFRNYVKKKYGVDIHASEGMWFGKYNDPELAKIGVKIRKVVQRKNDIVILAPGVLHWVRCRGKSVQTAWNFAYRRVEDIIAMNDRFQYNQKINFQTILLNKTLFMDMLNFEYHSLSPEVSSKLLQLVGEYYTKELALEDTLVLSPLKSKNIIIFYDQIPAQLKHIQIYYCSESSCAREIFCYFGVLRSQFAFQVDDEQPQQLESITEFCGKFYCPQCLISMKKVEDQLVIFRKFDLNSLKMLLSRVRGFNDKQVLQPAMYPITDLTNIGHFCGQIPNINDFIFNKDIRRLEQVQIPDVFLHQGVEEMHRFQLDLQQDKLLDFIDKPIMKFVTPLQVQRCDEEAYQNIGVDPAAFEEESSNKQENNQSIITTTMKEEQEEEELASESSSVSQEVLLPRYTHRTKILATQAETTEDNKGKSTSKKTQNSSNSSPNKKQPAKQRPTSICSKVPTQQNKQKRQQINSAKDIVINKDSISPKSNSGSSSSTLLMATSSNTHNMSLDAVNASTATTASAITIKNVKNQNKIVSDHSLELEEPSHKNEVNQGKPVKFEVVNLPSSNNNTNLIVTIPQKKLNKLSNSSSSADEDNNQESLQDLQARKVLEERKLKQIQANQIFMEHQKRWESEQQQPQWHSQQLQYPQLNQQQWQNQSVSSSQQLQYQQQQQYIQPSYPANNAFASAEKSHNHQSEVSGQGEDSSIVLKKKLV